MKVPEKFALTRVFPVTIGHLVATRFNGRYQTRAKGIFIASDKMAQKEGTDRGLFSLIDDV